MSSQFVRNLSSLVKRKRISIVGAGPSGFYVAHHLFKKSHIPLHITVWDKLPSPFGLSRYGVAPDHPEVKNCEETFTQTADKYFIATPDSNHKFEFIGGVSIGSDISLKTILENQDAVVLSYGCSGDRKLNIPGESTVKGVFSSRQFINWYNGHPGGDKSEELTKYNWANVSNVGIIGNGNVALDIARLLLSNKVKEIWESTDISPIALSCLRRAPIKNVKIIARRDFYNSKFTNKELRELFELEKYGIHGKISDKYFKSEELEKLSSDRAFKRRIEICSEYLKSFDERTKKNYKKAEPVELANDNIRKEWELDYLKSPVKIEANASGVIKSLELDQNKFTEDNKLIKDVDQPQIKYDIDLLITSLGYMGRPLKDFDDLNIKFSRDHLATENGRAINSKTNEIYPKLYGSGWIQTGSQGVIMSTMMNAFNVADEVLIDLEKDTSFKGKDINLDNIKHTTWSDWKYLDKSEIELGQLQNKKRVKYSTLEEAYSLLSKK
ncbi:hypothetical protein TPHA_0E01640 [Tetrapisispora phaffii CBS 4417]|uniref:NADPH:adrenodoxin oxidoreductase, mitochondrial n=1 Tax=Tetrapisispora phaffii (strain ATCC 24235 / CBS 4417 / NBRC 1672 / NRRL Y-8282 / UCD 70-5) TaxID=1071381 RepID=G8BTM9_TETPH|nr:hypothetical protein TPHA_0E01640 [Tetrapisispora phaffii CBS 4417]CCE63257.1 hypothetical protein TPHA_0E01640 [Tetrapisispora phaffii CBS 4417]